MDMHFQVDRTSSQPIYRQLAGWMETKINTGEWKSDHKFPGEVELAQSLGVSRGTLRKAISILIDRGLVLQIHGKGTFVGQPEIDQSFSGHLSIYQDLMLRGIPFTTEVLEKRLIPVPEKQAACLEISPTEMVFYLKRLRRVNGLPLVLQESFFPGNRFRGLLDQDFTNAGLVETVERCFGIRMEWAANTISVARAPSAIAASLGLKVGDAVLLSESITYDDAGNKMETGLTWFRPDRFRIKTVTRRAQNESFYAMLERAVNFGQPGTVLEKPAASANKETITHTLDKILPLERICVNFNASNWMEAILHAGRLFHETGAADEHYGRAMVETARKLGPYFVVAPGIAVAHALPSEGVIKPALALVSLKPPLPFGNSENDPVRLLIAIAAVDTSQHAEALKVIADALTNPARKAALMEAKTPQQALHILSKNPETINGT